MQEDEDDGFLASESTSPSETRCYGYMCVRYNDAVVDMLEELRDSDLVQDLDELNVPSTWIGHCIVTSIFVDRQSDVYCISLRLNQSSTTIPAKILSDASCSASVEWIPKTLADRYGF